MPTKSYRLQAIDYHISAVWGAEFTNNDIFLGCGSVDKRVSIWKQYNAKYSFFKEFNCGD